MPTFAFSGIPGKFWLTVFTALAVLAALSALAVFELRYVRVSWEVLSSGRRELSDFERESGNLTAAAGALERLAPEQELLRSSFADPQEPLAFIESIESLGRRFGLKLELSLAGGQGGDSVQAYAVTAAGTFRPAMSFFRNLESLPFLIELGDAEMRLFEGVMDETAKKKSEPLVRLNIIIRPLTL